MTLFLARAIVLLCLVTVGCARDASGDRWSGRFERRVGKAISTLSLWEEDGRRLACFGRRGGSAVETVRCGPGGTSEVVIDGQITFVYRTRLVPLPDGALQFEVDGAPAPGARGSEIHWKDRLVLAADGRELWSYGVELNGALRDPPSGPSRFAKVSDRPF